MLPEGAGAREERPRLRKYVGARRCRRPPRDHARSHGPRSRARGGGRHRPTPSVLPSRRPRRT